MRAMALVAAGFAVLALLWLGPLPGLARTAFFAHMTMHMGVVALAAPLVAFGLAGSRHDPVVRAPRLFAPLPASVIEFIVVWTWHAPSLHHAARHAAGGLVAEQGSFFAASLFVWLAAVGGAAPNQERKAAGIVALLLTFMHITLLGVLLSLAQRPLYAHGHEALGRTALEDQQLGGAIMLAGGAAYLLGGIWLAVGLLRGRVVAQAERP